MPCLGSQGKRPGEDLLLGRPRLVWSSAPLAVELTYPGALRVGARVGIVLRRRTIDSLESAATSTRLPASVSSRRRDSVTKCGADSGRNHLLLRDGEVGDAEEIEAVHWAGLEAAYLGRIRGWPDVPRDVRARVNRWRAWLAASETDVIVGEVDGGIVGFCALRPSLDPGLDPLTESEIPTLYVHPDHWHQGHGQELCREALQRAAKRGFASVVLWVVEVNSRARDLYLRLGFTPDGETRPEPHSVESLRASRYRISLGGAQ